ncbi:hypothetical protein [Streptomyces sp. NPDC055400]
MSVEEGWVQLKQLQRRVDAGGGDPAMSLASAASPTPGPTASPTRGATGDPDLGIKAATIAGTLKMCWVGDGGRAARDLGGVVVAYDGR